MNESQFNLPTAISGAGPGRHELPWDLKSPRSKERAAKLVSDKKSLGLIFHSLKNSAKKKRKSLAHILNRVSSPGVASRLSSLISKADRIFAFFGR